MSNPIPERKPEPCPSDQTESYWQIGFNDGYAGKERVYPTPDGPYELRNSGYSNGYFAGQSKRFADENPARFARLIAAIKGDV
jgi:hypothetical protein